MIFRGDIMQWDLLEEHQCVYDKTLCKKMNELTDLFDIIIDDMNLYPNMICVDVFPCKENWNVEISEYIRNYYKEFPDEEYLVSKNFKFSLDGVKGERHSIIEALKKIFESETVLCRCVSRPLNQNENMKYVAKVLAENAGTDTAESFLISKKDLEILQNVYVGILFSGWMLRCGKYGILILLGTNE